MKRRKWVKIASFVVLGLLAIPVIAVLYLVLSPDYLVLVVRSESMKPTFNMGDVIVLREYEGGDIEPGEIIAFEEQGFTITHRLVSSEGGVIRTKGDAVEDVDQWELQSSQVRGTYLFKIPYLGYVAKFLRSKVGALLLILAAVAFLAGLIVSELTGSRRTAEGGDGEGEPVEQEIRKREREHKQRWV
ncbi:MAG: signal peptidase I [Actinobacteria bacterium]|nr:signal peptidase I [Actinomycetota bacterium]